VPRDELAEAIWGETPPATWEKALSVLVSKLRGVLADAGVDGGRVLTAAFGCYRLDLPEGTWVDVAVATDATHEAEQALAAGDLGQARAAAALAEALLKLPFLPGEEGAWVEGKRRELDEVRARALGVLAEACLRSGRAAEAAKWAEQAVALEPFRETGYRRLMEAHAAAGNRAEALRVYERCRRLLAEELGAYPSPETESVYRELLAAPYAAAGPSPPREESEPERPRARGLGPLSRRRVGVAALVLAAAAGAAVGISATRGGARRVPVAVNSVVALDGSGSIKATVPVGAGPAAIAWGARGLWVANLDDRTVTRVDPSSLRVLRTIPVDGVPTGLAATGSAVWVADGAGVVSRIDPSYDRIGIARRLGSSGFSASASRPTVGAFGSLWIVDPDGFVVRADPESLRQTVSVDVGNDPSAIAVGAGSVWVANRSDGTVTRIDPATLLTATIPVGHGPVAIAVDAAGAWVANAGDGTVVRVDLGTNAVTETTHVGEDPAAVVATPSGLWVADAGDGTVVRLDPRTGAATRTIRLGGTPDALAWAGGRIWVAVSPAPPPTPAAGGVARFTLQADLPSYDPALATTPQFTYATCANLVTYPDKPAPEGSRIVPEVAQAVPEPTDGGRTYTFRIRSGFRFSPPSSEPVTAATFKATIERVADPHLKSPFAGELSGIVGYRAYVTGRAHDLVGVVARGRTLTIRLSQPNGGFLAWLAGGVACAVPAGTPHVELDDIPSAGPYYIASHTSGRQLVLRRNPHYHGERPHRLDEIVFTIGVDPSRALAEIEAGKADYALDGLPRDAGPKLQAEYGPGSKAAKDGRQQYFVDQADAVRWLHMNTSRPLFANVRLRRALNYALDRPALVAAARRFAEVNPFNSGEPTGDYLPPSSAGARHFHLYPANGPDLRRAKQLAGHLHATAIMYTPNVPPWVQEAQIVRRDLRPLGIDVQVKEMPLGDFYARIQRRGEPFDLAVSGWEFQTTDPAEPLSVFDGTTIRATANTDFSYLDDPAFDRQLAAAAKLSGPRRYRVYARLALELERDLAPAAAIATDASRDFFSARIGCQLYQPVYGIDLAALCLRR
jgi:YVTN family beta-propeller protein